jgi:hypothetical protein
MPKQRERCLYNESFMLPMLGCVGSILQCFFVQYHTGLVFHFQLHFFRIFFRFLQEATLPTTEHTIYINLLFLFEADCNMKINSE